MKIFSNLSLVSRHSEMMHSKLPSMYFPIGGQSYKVPKTSNVCQWEFGSLVKRLVWTADSAGMRKVWDDPILHQTRPAGRAYRWGGQACWISQLDWINRASTNICSPSIIRLLFTLSFTLEIDTFQCNALSDQAWQPIYIAACIK